ncbi:hypothetical protein Tco_1468503 [Tanacetum coccineum]
MATRSSEHSSIATSVFSHAANVFDSCSVWAFVSTSFNGFSFGIFCHCSHHDWLLFGYKWDFVVFHLGILFLTWGSGWLLCLVAFPVYVSAASDMRVPVSAASFSLQFRCLVVKVSVYQVISFSFAASGTVAANY